MMTRTETRITAVMRSPAFTLLLVAVMVTAALLPVCPGVLALPEAAADFNRGLLLPSPGEWLELGSVISGRWAMWLNLLTVGMMLLINRRFNILRTYTWLFAGIFAVMECASPQTLQVFSSGMVGTTLMLWCMWMMYSTYHRSRRIKRVYLTFVLLSAASMVQYAFVVYLAVMMVACAQMRVLSWNSIVAALLGVATPWWIVLGFGWASPADVSLPEISFDGFDLTAPEQLVALYGPVALTLLTGLVAGLVAIFDSLALNARMRAVHGMLSVLSIVTGVMTLADFTNISFYLPLLNMFVAFQTGLLFRITVRRRAYIWVALLLAANISIWIWKLTGCHIS